MFNSMVHLELQEQHCFGEGSYVNRKLLDEVEHCPGFDGDFSEAEGCVEGCLQE